MQIVEVQLYFHTSSVFLYFWLLLFVYKVIVESKEFGIFIYIITNKELYSHDEQGNKLENLNEKLLKVFPLLFFFFLTYNFDDPCTSQYPPIHCLVAH